MKRVLPSFSFEQTQWQLGHAHVAGVDEVGRGALAGPIVAAAVVFASDHIPLVGVTDSKLLTVHQRQTFADQIKHTAVGWAIGVGNVELINEQGIIVAQKYAMTSALEQLTNCNAILIDGLPFKQPLATKWELDPNYIVKGDQKSYSIAAASILAKVYRDELMAQLAKKYPEYGWDRNKGYGTKLHCQTLKIQGMTQVHRELFCRKVFE